MRYLLLILFLVIQPNLSIAQKYTKDSLMSLFKENEELKKRIQEFEKSTLKTENGMQYLEKIQNTWLNVILTTTGTTITLFLVGVGFSYYDGKNKTKNAIDIFEKEKKESILEVNKIKEAMEQVYEQYKISISSKILNEEDSNE